MASSQAAAQKWKNAEQAEQQLQALIQEDRPTYHELDHLIHEMRVASEQAMFLDIEYADRASVGKRLWDAHTLINARYRKLLDRFRKSENKKFVVERRKTEKHYVDFLKTTTFFYKGYIQRLASNYGGIPELKRIANSLELSTLSLDETKKASVQVERLVKLSTHATLWRLGDLSRYRNQIRTNNRSWQPALALYQLANDLYPASGYGHNQMAVIALAEENHLNAVYHIYRALTAEEPHPLAKGNLEVEFKKIIAGWEKRRQLPRQDSLNTLVWWFCLLHAYFYAGVDFPTHGELENEVLSRMALLLKEQSFPEILEKFVLVSLAAEYYAAKRVREENGNEKVTTSYFFCMGFNVRMMCTLLQVLLPELEEQLTGDDLPHGAQQPRERVSAIARRVLPSLRQYGVWIARSSLVLLTGIGPPSLQVHKRELWNVYANVLTRLADCFPVAEMSQVVYLLEEDESTVGFLPLQDPELGAECDLHIDSYGQMKPRTTDHGVERHHPNLEMESRILDILLCALRLERDAKIPITLSDAGDSRPVFRYNEGGLPASVAGPRSREATISPVATPSQANTSFAVTNNAHTPALTSIDSADRSISLRVHDPKPDEVLDADRLHDMDDNVDDQMDDHMEQMVDNLLRPSQTGYDETSYGMGSRTADDIFAPSGFNGTPKLLPSLPGSGYYNSAFVPKPNELQPSSPNRPVTRGQMSPLSLSTHQERLAAAEELDETCFGAKRSSWGRGSSQLSNYPLQPSEQLMHSAITRPDMSGFTNSSSVYHNSTPFAPGRATAVTGKGNSAFVADAGDYGQATMLNSSIWNNSQRPSYGIPYSETPPGGQGG